MALFTVNLARIGFSVRSYRTSGKGRKVNPTATFNKPRTSVVAVLAALAMVTCALQFGIPPKADADLSPDGVYGFCGNYLVHGNEACFGPASEFYQVFGYGDQHSVCVLVGGIPSTERCSSGPGAGVYSGEVSSGGTPVIRGNAEGDTNVHGDILTH
jgi:hypothetical protein